MRFFVVTCLLFMGLLVHAKANDSSASLEAGGLVLKKQEKIAILSEDLFISPKYIEVNYVFENRSNRDIKTIVAFPMPDLPDNPLSDISIPFPDQDNFLNFKVWVDGKPVTVNIEKKRVEEGEHCGSDDACYVEKITYYWVQTFPAAKKISIRHTYTPSVGGSVGASPLEYAEMIKANNNEVDGNDVNTFCIEDSFLRALSSKQTKEKYTHVSDQWFGYILKTGANWAGGQIGDFRLIVDKEKQENLISFCAEGVNKISPTRFEVRKKNYTPTRDLDFLLLGGWSR